jgi:hypothetical protein
MEMIIFKLRPLYSENEPRYLLPRALAGLHSQSGSLREGKKS